MCISETYQSLKGVSLYNLILKNCNASGFQKELPDVNLQIQWKWSCKLFQCKSCKLFQCKKISENFQKLFISLKFKTLTVVD